MQRVEGVTPDGDVAGRQHPLNQEVRKHARDEHRGVVAEVERALHVAALLDAHQQDARQRGYDAEPGNGHRQQDRREPAELVLVAQAHLAAQHHGGQDGGHVGAEQVGAHAGHVAHVVAHVIGDGGRVAGVVLRDAGLNLAHEVGAHVGGLGVDAAAHPRKQGNAFGAERKAGEHFEGFFHLHAAGRATLTDHEQLIEYNKQGAQPEHGQPGHAHAHDRAAGEAHVQRVTEAGFRRLGGAHVGFGGDFHPDIAGRGRKHCPNQKGNDDNRARPLAGVAEVAQKHRGNEGEQSQHPVLGPQKGNGAVGNIAGDGLHLGVAGILAGHPARPQPGIE